MLVLAVIVDVPGKYPGRGNVLSRLFVIEDFRTRHGDA
jgi:hypothetical protein